MVHIRIDVNNRRVFAFFQRAVTSTEWIYLSNKNKVNQRQTYPEEWLVAKCSFTKLRIENKFISGFKSNKRRNRPFNIHITVIKENSQYTGKEKKKPNHISGSSRDVIFFSGEL